MIKVTREFATVEEAVAFLQGTASEETPPFLRNKPTAAPAAPAPVAAAPAPLPPAPPAPPAPPVAAAPVAAPAISAAPVAASHGITQAQIAAAAQAYSKAYKPAATKAVFTHFGITKISDAKPEIYPQLLQSLTVQAA